MARAPEAAKKSGQLAPGHTTSCPTENIWDFVWSGRLSDVCFGSRLQRVSHRALFIVVQLSAWREELYRKGVLDRDAKSPREEFNRVRNSLQARDLIGVRDNLAWKV